MLASFSVRTRIVLLALIPVAGFVANGFTYTSGEGDVGRTFGTSTRSAALADASRDFKSAVASMRIVTKDFSVKPNDSLVAGFEYAYAVALRNLDTIEASIDKGHAESIAGMSRNLNALREEFNNLVREQNTLGFDESSGLRRQLQVAGRAVERIINDNTSWRSEADTTKLMVTLLSMRHHEADFRVTESELARQQFHDRGDRRADWLNSVGGGGRVTGDRSSRCHHPRNVVDRHNDGCHGGPTEFGRRFHR